MRLSVVTSSRMSGVVANVENLIALDLLYRREQGVVNLLTKLARFMKSSRMFKLAALFSFFSKIVDCQHA